MAARRSARVPRQAKMTTLKTKPKLLTADDLLRLYSQGVRGELIRGVLRETMPTGEEHGEVAANTVIILGGFVKPRRLGRIITSDAGVLLERDPDTVREPDVAFISYRKRPRQVRNTRYAQVAPELVVEIRSPRDSASDLVEKALMWLAHGVLIVWVINPDTRTVDVYRAGAPVATLADGDALDGGDALPGFTCAVSDIFDL